MDSSRSAWNPPAGASVMGGAPSPGSGTVSGSGTWAGTVSGPGTWAGTVSGPGAATVGRTWVRISVGAPWGVVLGRTAGAPSSPRTVVAPSTPVAAPPSPAARAGLTSWGMRKDSSPS